MWITFLKFIDFKKFLAYVCFRLIFSGKGFKKFVRVTISKKNLTITPALANYVDAKIVRPVQKLLSKDSVGDLPILDLQIGRSSGHHRKGKVYFVRATLRLNGKLMRAEVAHEDVRAACDVMEEELRQDIVSWRDKNRTLFRRGARSLKKELHFDPAARLRKSKRRAI